MGSASRGIISLSFSDGSDMISTWERLTLRESFLDPLGSLSVTIRPLRKQITEYRLKLAKGSLIKLFIDGHQQLAFVVTTITTTIGGNGVSYDVAARSVLITPYEGSVNPNLAKSYNSDTTVVEVVRDAMLPYGFNEVVSATSRNLKLKSGGSIPGLRNKDIKVDGLKHKDIQPQPNEKAYGFCSRIFSRVGCVLHVDAEGFLMLTYPYYEQDASYNLIQSTEPSGRSDVDRMIGNVTWTDTNDGQFSEVVVLGKSKNAKKQTRTNRPAHRVKVNDLADREGAPFLDVPTTEIEPGWHSYGSSYGSTYKPRIVVDKRARDSERAEIMANLLMGNQAAKAFQVKCTVDGVVASTGRIWTINTIANVKMLIFQTESGATFNEDMWILERTITANREGGQQTQLTLIPKYSLVLGKIPDGVARPKSKPKGSRYKKIRSEVG